MNGYATRHGRKQILLRVDYDAEMVVELKSLPEAKWNPSQKSWLVSSRRGALEDVLEFCDEHDVEVYPDVEDLVREREVEESTIGRGAIDRAHSRAAALGLSLYDFQPRGVSFLAMRESALLAWEMGTGKTIVALSALPDDAAVLVISPATVKYNWEAEVAKWRPELSVTVLEGRGQFRYPKPGEVVVLNYDILPKATRVKRRLELSVPHPGYKVHVILDEIRKVKNAGTARTKACRAIMRDTQEQGGCTWGLDGTPFSNKPPELWSILQGLRLAETAFGSYPRFRAVMGWREPEDPASWERGYWGKPLPESRKRLGRVMDRVRLQRDWGEPLVTYLEVDIKMGARERAAGFKFFDDWQKAAGKQGKAQAMTQLATHRKALASAKMAAIEEYLTSLEEEGEPAVVFSAHRDPVLRLSKRKGWTHIIGGSVSLKKRFQRIKDYQDGKHKGIALTIRSGGEGITLTKSRKVIFVDLDWAPDWNAQAIARLDRSGQTQRVHVIIVVARDTVDGHVLKVNQSKTHMMSVVLDGVEPGRKPKKRPVRVKKKKAPKRTLAARGGEP